METCPPALDTTPPAKADSAAASPDRGPVGVKLALQKSQGVEAKVEECADDLGSANEDVKKKLAEGSNLLHAHEVLTNGESMQGKIQDCAVELHDANDILAQGIDDLKQVEAALVTARINLLETEATLEATRKEEKNARLRAARDSLTGLLNRDLFDDRLKQAISLAGRNGWTLAVMFLDLNQFKGVNDTHGHPAGDEILRGIAKRLSQHSRDSDTVCRYGGDEFLLLLMNPDGRDNIDRIAGELLKTIALPIDFLGTPLIVSSSIGIAIYPDDGTTAEQLIANADAAMYRAKKEGLGHTFC